MFGTHSFTTYSGERGIRTPGTSQYAGFQDRCIRPLCHLSNRGNAIDVALQSQLITIPLCFISGCKVTLFSSYLQIFGLLFSSISEKTLVSTHFTASEAARNTSISRRHHKNKRFFLYCLRFAVTLNKLRCTSTIKICKLVLKCLLFAVTLNKLRCTSTIKICKHILYCLRFAVTLHL